MKVYAECNIVINPIVVPESVRRRVAEVNMDIFTSQGVGPSDKPITLVLKGENFAHVMDLMTTFRQTDESLAEKAKASVLADEVDGMSDKEIGEWVRGNILTEIAEMGGADESPLVSG